MFRCVMCNIFLVLCVPFVSKMYVAGSPFVAIVSLNLFISFNILRSIYVYTSMKCGGYHLYKTSRPSRAPPL